MIIDIVPVPAPRQVRSDAWKPRDCVLRYRAFRDDFHYLTAGKTIPALEESHVSFAIPMPSSWSEKKRNAMNGRPHTQKPDIDNLFKALADTMHVQDSHIWKISASKVWGYAGKITISQM